MTWIGWCLGLAVGVHSGLAFAGGVAAIASTPDVSGSGYCELRCSFVIPEHGDQVYGGFMSTSVWVGSRDEEMVEDVIGPFPSQPGFDREWSASDGDVLHTDVSGFQRQPIRVSEQTPPGIGDDSSSQRFFPIWGEEARKQGYELPLPWGLSFNYSYIKQDFDITQFKLGLGGQPPSSVQLLQFDPVEATTNAYLGRLDLWVLPFLNIYGLGGYTKGRFSTVVTIPALLPIGTSRRVPVELDYEGPTYGGGMTLAGGYKEMFVSFDINYTITSLEFFTSDITALTLAPRAGWQGRIGWFKGAVYAGAMFQDLRQTLAGTVVIDPGSPAVQFEVDQENVTAWNPIAGVQWELTPHWFVIAEGGFGDRDMAVVSLGGRL